jgi:hypothetical protein
MREKVNDPFTTTMEHCGEYGLRWVARVLTAEMDRESRAV